MRKSSGALGSSRRIGRAQAKEARPGGVRGSDLERTLEEDRESRFELRRCFLLTLFATNHMHFDQNVRKTRENPINNWLAGLGALGNRFKNAFV